MPASLDDAVAQLRRDPFHPVRAQIDDLEIEIRVVAPERPRRLGSYLASLGPWEGESAEALTSRLREARDAGGSVKSIPA